MIDPMEPIITDTPAAEEPTLPELEQPQAEEPAAAELAAPNPPEHEPQEQPASQEPAPEPVAPARQEGPAAPAPEADAVAEEEAEPAAPEAEPQPAPDASARKRQYWRSILTGNPATVPAAVRRQTGVDEWDLPEEQKEYRMLATLNRSWAADHLERTPEHIRTHWRSERAELARRLHVRDNEQEVFLALSQEAEDEPRREASKRIHERFYLAGLDDEWQPEPPEEMEGLSAEDREHALQLAQAAYADGKQMRRELGDLAERIAHGMDAFAAVEDEAIAAPRVLMAAPDLLQAVDALADMDEPRRRTALYLAAGILRGKAAASEAPGLVGRVGQAVRRGTANLALGVVQGLSHAGIATLSNMSRLLESESLGNAAQAWDKRMQVLNELRHLSQDELRPLVLPGKEGSAESYLTTAAESAPAALLSCCGGAGFTALTLGAVGDSVAEARARAPLADQELQLYAGLLAGSIQAGIYMNLNRLGGRLLEQSISRIGRASGKGLADYSLAGLNVMGGATADMAAMLAAGKLAGAADLGAQEMAARLSHTAANIDWKTYGDNLADIETNLHEAASLLPFMLLGSGRLALQHFRSPYAILGDGSCLADWGITPEQQRAIMGEPRLEAKSTLLQKALRSTELWNNLGSSPKAWRAMQLLHSDNFGEFRDPNRVCDFLQLPAPAHEIVSNPQGAPPLDVAQAGGNERRAAVWDMWNEWWKLSRVSEPGWIQLYRSRAPRMSPAVQALPQGIEMHPELLSQLREQIPPELRKNAISDDMGAEETRAALLDERITDLKSLSYLMLLNTHSVDNLERSFGSIKEIRNRAENTRQAMLLAVGRAVASLGSGAGRWEAMQTLDEDLRQLYLRHKGKLTSSDWLRSTQNRKLSEMIRNPFLHDAQTQENGAEMQQFLRIMTGVHMDAEALMDLLPDSREFQAALAQGIPPGDVFVGLVSSHLGVPEEALRKSIKAEPLRNATPMEEYARQNLSQFEVYRQLTGYELSYTTGDDNRRYIRATRPDGSATLWYGDEQTAINDLVGNATLSHMPLSMPADAEPSASAPGLYASTADGSYNLLDREKAQFRVYSKYDQQCSAAMYHLGAAWMENATGLQPGLFVEKNRCFLYENEKEDFTRPHIRENDSRHVVELLTETTPLSMIESRAAVFWDRMLQSGYVSLEQMGNYLVDKQYMSREECETILSQKAPPAHYRREHIRNNREAHRERHEMSLRSIMLHKMVDYTGLSAIARLQELPLPQEVKNWVGMAAFCPEPPPIRPTSGSEKGEAVSFGRDGSLTVSWANRRVAQRLRERAGQISELRRGLQAAAESPAAPASPMDELMNELVGMDDAMSYEKGWCHRAGGVAAVHGVPQAYWNVLRSPMRAWQTMGEKQQASLRRYVEAHCRQVPEFCSQEGRDPVEVGLETLDELLRTHPEMHRYSLAEHEPTRVRQMELEAPSREFLGQFNFRRPMPIYRGNRPVRAGYRVGADEALPELLDADPRMPAGMALLDKLRHWEIDLPSVDNSGIWWKGELYGGAGKWPASLNRDEFVAEQPLGPIINTLRDISKYNARGKQMEICGVKMRGLEADVDLSPLQGITIYRSRRYPTHILRLMPGDTTLENSAMRTPYLVHCNSGVYMDRHAALREADAMERAYVPLHEATPVKDRPYVTRSRGDWRWQGINHSLRMLHELPCNTAEEIPGNSARLLEVLMRLGEDSGFSHGMRTEPLRSMSPQELRVLNLMGDMISMLCSPQPGEALQRMQQALPLMREGGRPAADTVNSLLYMDKTQAFGKIDRQSLIETHMLPAAEPSKSGQKAKKPRRKPTKKN